MVRRSRLGGCEEKGDQSEPSCSLDAWSKAHLSSLSQAPIVPLTHIPGDSSNFERFPVADPTTMPGIFRAMSERKYGFSAPIGPDTCRLSSLPLVFAASTDSSVYLRQMVISSPTSDLLRSSLSPLYLYVAIPLLITSTLDTFIATRRLQIAIPQSPLANPSIEVVPYPLLRSSFCFLQHIPRSLLYANLYTQSYTTRNPFLSCSQLSSFYNSFFLFSRMNTPRKASVAGPIESENEGNTRANLDKMTGDFRSGIGGNRSKRVERFNAR